MERRPPVPKSAKRPHKRPKVDLATTALGETPAKRGLKPEAAGAKSAAETPNYGARELAVRLKTAKQRTPSSARWLERQLNDPYVARARAEGWRSRAAYKLLEIDDKFRLLRAGSRVVDLGAAPGGWTQVAVKRGAGVVVGVDYLPTAAVPGATLLELDFLDPAAPDRLKATLGGDADVVLSDMAAPTTGHRTTDHLRIIGLAEAALDFAEDVLAPGGAFVCKVFQGGAEGALLARLRKGFETVKHVKPKSSRADSSEMYVVAVGRRGGAA
ncbi:MAG: RlmE family RNA methyltransferase [Parvularculaceae bacterium]|nr:RlmE family RNA methyltransferase [Parvularculaceae bacterium]